MFPALIDDIRHAGGAAGRAYLVSRGHSDRHLAEAVQARAVVRARRGWYSIWPEGDLRLRALRLGGRLTGLSAIQAWAGWVLSPGRMHVAVPANAARLRCPQSRRVQFTQSLQRESVTLHWMRERHDRDTSSGIVSLAEALEVVCLTEPAEQAIAAIDWARRSGRIDAIGLEALIFSLPRARRVLVRRSSASCHSLPESLARTRLTSAGLQVREQVGMPDHSSPIDLVIENAIALDIDGDEFHRNRFLFDRTKDLAATRAGFHAVRPAARHVFLEWASVFEAIRVALTARGVPLVAKRIPSASASGVDNSGLSHRRRRARRANPRTSSLRPRRRPPIVLSC